MNSVPGRDPLVARRVPLKLDFARLTSGRFAAIQVETGPRREFVVATDVEAAQGWIPDDGRPRFDGLHEAFDVAHRMARRREALARAA